MGTDHACQWEVRVAQFTIQMHALERRLQYEGASAREWQYIIQNKRAEIVDAVLEELRSAKHLSAIAKTVLSHPWREAHRGLDPGDRLLPAHQHGTKITRGDTGSYYLASPSVCYIAVAAGSVVTTICPNEAQLRRVREIDGSFEIPVHAPRITRILEDARTEISILRNATKTHVIAANQSPAPVMRDDFFQIPRWLRRKPGASWKILLVNVLGDGNELAGRVCDGIAETSFGGPPDKILVEGSSALALVNLLQALRERLRETHVIRLPDLESVPAGFRWARIVGCCRPTSGKVLMILSPKTGQALVNMVERAHPADPIDTRLFFPGQIFRLALGRSDENRLILRVEHVAHVPSLTHT